MPTRTRLLQLVTPQNDCRYQLRSIGGTTALSAFHIGIKCARVVALILGLRWRFSVGVYIMTTLVDYQTMLSRRSGMECHTRLRVQDRMIGAASDKTGTGTATLQLFEDCPWRAGT
jgi:hypothetical protein